MPPPALIQHLNEPSVSHEASAQTSLSPMSSAIPPHARHYLPPTFEEEMILERREQLAHVANGVNVVRAESRLLVGRPATALIKKFSARTMTY